MKNTYLFLDYFMKFNIILLIIFLLARKNIPRNIAKRTGNTNTHLPAFPFYRPDYSTAPT